MDFILKFNTDEWLCTNNNFSCKSNSLKEIDDLIIKYLKNNQYKGKIKINMKFDFDSFPLWMRQYMPHYFNREFSINL